MLRNEPQGHVLILVHRQIPRDTVCNYNSIQKYLLPPSSGRRRGSKHAVWYCRIKSVFTCGTRWRKPNWLYFSVSHLSQNHDKKNVRDSNPCHRECKPNLRSSFHVEVYDKETDIWEARHELILRWYLRIVGEAWQLPLSHVQFNIIRAWKIICSYESDHRPSLSEEVTKFNRHTLCAIGFPSLINWKRLFTCKTSLYALLCPDHRM